MPDAAVVIDPSAPTDPGLDYARLLELGIGFVQQMSSDSWTDYNEHDPGVTLLEALCFALTDLSFRTGFPIVDVLAEGTDGQIDTHRQGLLTPRRVLSSAATTMDDLRRLLVDRTPGVANAWLEACRTDAVGGVNGLYDIVLFAPHADPYAADRGAWPSTIQRAARRVFCRHRALCEDVSSIMVLRPALTRVEATVTMDGSLSPEASLANALFRLGEHLAPQLTRASLKTVMAGGGPPSEVFEGPLLRHGFISADQLKPRLSSVTLPAMAQAMAGGEGVVTVTQLTAEVGGRRYAHDDTIPIPPEVILRLSDQDLDGFRLVQGHHVHRFDPVRVHRELQRLRLEHGRTYPLAADYRGLFPAPRGRNRNLGAYRSMQELLPRTYGVGSLGIRPPVSIERRAQARQLKGYLLPFEQLMANFVRQLASARDLLSVDRKVTATYVSQSLAGAVPDVAPLLTDGYEAGLAALVADGDRAVARRSRFLDLLLALYGERLDGSMLVEPPGAGPQAQASGERLLKAKFELLHHLVAAGRQRGAGLDYLSRTSARQSRGPVVRSRIELGLAGRGDPSAAEAISALALELIIEEAQGALGRILEDLDDHFDEHFTAFRPIYEEHRRTRRRPARAEPLGRVALSEGLLLAAVSLDNFHIGSLPGGETISVVCRSPAEMRWRLVGTFESLEAAVALAEQLVEMAERVRHGGRQLYLVEHVLLRQPHHRGTPATPPQPTTPTGTFFNPSFTVTAVVAEPWEATDPRPYRRAAAKVIRRNTPAHVAIEYCFLSPWRMLEFEQLHGMWRDALRGDRQRLEEVARRLRAFLHHHRLRPHPTDRAD